MNRNFCIYAHQKVLVIVPNYINLKTRVNSQFLSVLNFLCSDKVLVPSIHIIKRKMSFDSDDGDSTQREAEYIEYCTEVQFNYKSDFLFELNRDGHNFDTVADLLEEVLNVKESDEFQYKAIFESKRILTKVLEIDWKLLEFFGEQMYEYYYLNDNLILSLIEEHGKEVIKYLNESENFKYKALLNDEGEFDAWEKIEEE